MGDKAEITPQSQLSISDFFKANPGARDDEVLTWMESASDEVLLVIVSRYTHRPSWHEHAKSLLLERHAEAEAKSANKLIAHTERLTQQTDKLITESVNLSKLTKVLIWLTVILAFFAAIQIVLMVYDIWKHK